MLLVIAGISLMIALDLAIVTIALPTMGRYFHRNQADMTWAVNAFSLAFGGLLLLGGRAGDRFGRRQMIIIGLAVFTLGSLSAGLATSFELMLAGRVAQGIGAAVAAPTALSLITIEFEEGSIRNRAIAVYAAVSGAGAGIGVLLGGVLTEYLSWRWVLFVNVPIGLGLIVAAYYFIGDSERLRGRIDLVGSVLSVAGMTGLVYAFIHAANSGWGNTRTVLVLATSVLILVAFAMYEGYLAPVPIVPSRIFHSRNRCAAYLIILIVGASLFGMFYFITFFVQGVLGYSALKAGLAFLPAVAFIAISAQLSAMLLPRFGPKTLVVFGTVVLTGGLSWLSRVGADTGYVATLLPATFVLAVGLGAVLVPLTALVTSRIAGTDAGLASAVLNVGQQVGASIGLAVLANRAASAATSAGTTEGFKLVARYGLASDHLQNYLILAKAATSGTVAPPASLSDTIARHSINVVQAHAAGVGFATAAIFGAGAILVAIVGITAKKPAPPT